MSITSYLESEDQHLGTDIQLFFMSCYTILDCVAT